MSESLLTAAENVQNTTTSMGKIDSPGGSWPHGAAMLFVKDFIVFRRVRDETTSSRRW